MSIIAAFIAGTIFGLVWAFIAFAAAMALAKGNDQNG